MIDTKLLRQKLIDMAMRGLLVEQRPEDGHATDLLEQIRAEKAALIKAGKIKKEKPLPEIKEEEKPFAIPANWCWVRLGEIVELSDGTRINNSEYPYLHVKYLRGQSQASIKFEGKFVTRRTKLLLVDGENSGEIFTTEEDGYMGSTFKALTYYSKLYSEDYIEIVIRKNGDKYKANKKGTAIPHLNKELFFLTLVSLPPLAEQERIVTALESCLKLVDTIAKDSADLDKALKFLRQKMLDMAVRGQLVEQRPEDGNATDLLEQIRAEKVALIKAGKIKKEKPLPEIKEEEKPFAIPANWCWVRLGEIGILLNGFAYKSTQYVSSSNNIVIRIGNVKNDKLILDKATIYIDDQYAAETNQYKIGEKDILVTMTGTRHKRDYFQSYLVKSRDIANKKLHLNQRVGCLRLFEENLAQYIVFVIKNKYALDIVFRNETGTANQGNIRSADILNLSIPLPPLAEQKRIVAKLEQINALIETALN